MSPDKEEAGFRLCGKVFNAGDVAVSAALPSRRNSRWRPDAASFLLQLFPDDGLCQKEADR